MGDVIRVCDEVFGKAAVLRVASELHLRTDGFPTCQAILTMAACRVKPRHAYPVTLLHPPHPRSDGNDQADGLVARDERQRGLPSPITARRVKIGVTYSASFSLDQDLPRRRRRDVPFPKHQRLSKLLNNCRLHLESH